jgi:N6-L-threonylcarbamoyladenine synthase
MKPNYTILAIETSLDDTCAAVTIDDRVVSNVVASQTAFHEEWGGTVPYIAKRKHIEWIDKTIDESFRRAPACARVTAGRQGKLTSKDVDAVAVTFGPGLAPCLEVGIAKAKELAKSWGKPLIAVNHMEGHLLSSLARNSKGSSRSFAQTCLPAGRASKDCEQGKLIYPVLGFLISGGHTELVLMKDLGKYELLGETLDDAAGEAYDKVARMLNLGYPGGPILSELAKQGDPTKYPFPEPMRLRKDLNFSFSGIKTAALYKLRELNVEYTREFTADFAASFQAAVLKMLMRRLKRAIEQYQPKMVLLGGGVVSNAEIRKAARLAAREYNLRVYIPYSPKLFTDNAAMIGVAAWYKAKRGECVENMDELDRQPNLNFTP